MMKSKQAGFTLIELVVVIVILGILAATALPKLQSLDNQARIASLNGALASFQSSAVISYGVSKQANTYASILANTVLSDPLVSFDSTTCNGGGTATSFNISYTGFTTLASVVGTVSGDLCSG